MEIKIKKIFIFILFIGCLLKFSYAEAIVAIDEHEGLQLELLILRDKIILGEPFHAFVKLKNVSSKKIAIPYDSIGEHSIIPNKYAKFKIDAPSPYLSRKEYRACSGNVIKDGFEISKYINPGEEVISDIGYEVTCSFYTTGLHKLTFIYEIPDKYPEYDKEEVANWRGKLEASVSFYISEPQDGDAVIFRDYIEKWANEPVEPCYCLFSVSRERMKQYPSSIYVAWAYYEDLFGLKEEVPKMFNLDNRYITVKDIIRMIKEKTYEDTTSVYNFDEARIEKFKSGEGILACKLIKERLQLILKYHPDFVFANHLNIRIALCNIEIGNEEEGLTQLKGLLQKEQNKALKEKIEISPEGKWIEEFLKEWSLNLSEKK